ncbi:hypothetical protein IQ265_04750 [Nodosilinea sp. LEGE 06152]|uniref:hypothetical protein n=1 Tax=Nodosilinea sp. LEGE 06152 TaxID=2777966 RepID=UPI00187E9824|nr:hypothetical protein [Nodosilinea sp. LEGE 06152]MBE9156144.1 hypothetical protein [Nodosilinea sp. LEGE 06152]
MIDEFGRDSPLERLRDRFLLTYGFCSMDRKRWLAKKDPATGKKHGIATSGLDAAKLPLA